MKIDLTNYESFLLDYLDGKLSAVEVEEVLLFLENHPDIKEEFDGVNEIFFQTETTSFDPAFLHKPQFAEVKQQYESLLVAQLEGDISISDQLILQQGFILYPELHHEEQLFAQTRLVPEPSLVFPNKYQLQKGNLLVLHRQTILRIAAVLLVTSLAGLFWSQLNRNISLPAAQTIAPKTTPKLQRKQNNPVISSPQFAQIEQPVNTPLDKPQTVVQSNHLANTVLIAPKQNVSIENPSMPETVSLKKSKAWLKYPDPVETKADRFVSLPDFLRDKLTAETKQLEQKTKNTLQEMNKTAGITIQKDSSGRITHFEIEAWGFAWSQTK